MQSPDEIKRREVSWTLTKKLDSFASPGESKRREVVLGSESWTYFASVVSQQHCYGHCLCDCSAQQLKQQLRSTVFATQWRGPHCHNIFVVLAAVHGLLGLRGRCARSSHQSVVPFPPVPVPNKPPRFCGRKAK